MATITVGVGKDYSSIYTALSNARVGTAGDYDIIEVYDGTYTEEVISSVVDYIEIKAAPSAAPILDGETTRDYAFWKVGSSGAWIVDGFEIKNYSNSSTNAAVSALALMVHT